MSFPPLEELRRMPIWGTGRVKHIDYESGIVRVALDPLTIALLDEGRIVGIVGLTSVQDIEDGDSWRRMHAKKDEL